MDLTALERSAERLAALEEQVSAEREIRNRLICEAMQEGQGHGYTKVRRAARLKSNSTIAWIIGEAS